MAAIVCENLSFRYSATDRDAIHAISFVLPAGSITAVMGASGGGKSTLLKTIAGILPGQHHGVQQGRVLLSGKTPLDYSTLQGVGYVFQDYRLLPFRTVLQNATWPLLHGRRQHSYDAKTLELEAKELVELVGLSAASHSYPRELSGGMQARAALVRALTGRPGLLLIDEAFSGLDVGWRIALHRQLSELRAARSVGIIFISHDIEDACEIADQVLLIAPDGMLAGIVGRSGRSAGRYASDVRDLLLQNHPAQLRK